MVQRRKQGETSERLRILSIRLAYIFVALTIVISVVFFILSRDSTAATLQAQQNQTETAIMLLKDKASSIFLLKKRIALASSILKSRKNYDVLLSSTLSGLGADTRVDTYSITSKTISVTASSSNLSSLNSWLDTLKTQTNPKGLFSKLSIDNFILDTKSGLYSLSITVTFL